MRPIGTLKNLKDPKIELHLSPERRSKLSLIDLFRVWMNSSEKEPSLWDAFKAGSDAEDERRKANYKHAVEKRK